MQRHDRRVPVCSPLQTPQGPDFPLKVSFFSRYTRDIIAFAEAHTEGKVVSVLEGGYSDRALTSATMGHVIGMLNKSGDPTWWSESELVNVSNPV